MTTAPDVPSDDVAALAVELRLVQGDGRARSGAWARPGELPLNRKVSGGRADLLGLGRIGRATGERPVAFGMQIHRFACAPKDTPPGYDPAPRPRVACPAGRMERGLHSRRGGDRGAGLGRSHRGAGPLGRAGQRRARLGVDEARLIAAPDAGRPRGAALDAFRGEPNVEPRLLAQDGVMLPPHRGSGTAESRAAVGRRQRASIAGLPTSRCRPRSPDGGDRPTKTLAKGLGKSLASRLLPCGTPAASGPRRHARGAAISKAGRPSTARSSVTPSPGASEAAIVPATRCGAPGAKATVP